jgi:hypothetical protein
MSVAKWCHSNLEASDIIAVIVVIATVFLSYFGIGGEDLPKYVMGGIIGYLTHRAKDEADKS